MLQTIIYEDINDKFGFGEYLGFKVIIMKENGYINASRMCSDISKEINKDKRFRNWKILEQAKELIECVENELKADAINLASAFITVKSQGKQEFQFIQGHYVHPDIIIHIAQWASPKIALKVSKIMNEYIISNYKNEIQEKNEIITEKNKIIDLNNAFMKGQDEYLVIHHKEDNKYYVARVKKESITRAINRGNNNKFLYVETIHLVKNSVYVINEICKKLNIIKNRNEIIYDGDIKVFINEIVNFVKLD